MTRHFMAALVLLSMIGLVAMTEEFTARRVRLQLGAMRCPDFHSGQPLNTAIYHADGSVACHYNAAPRRQIGVVIPAHR